MHGLRSEHIMIVVQGGANIVGSCFPLSVISAQIPALPNAVSQARYAQIKDIMKTPKKQALCSMLEFAICLYGARCKHFDA